MECPKCKSETVARSRRHSFIERVLFSFIHVYPFRCGECKTRFFRYRFRQRDSNTRLFINLGKAWKFSLLLVIAIVMIIGFIVYSERKSTLGSSSDAESRIKGE